MTHAQNYALAHNTADSQDAFCGKLNAVMITWSYGGKKVAVTGSWDNWDKRYSKYVSFMFDLLNYIAAVLS